MSYLSRVQYTGTGSNALYSIPFAYISKAYVEVRVGGALLADGVGYTWQSATSILLSAGNLATGVVLDIRRATTKTSKLVDFQDGSVLTEASLDLANDQVFQLVAETIDDMQDRIAVQTDGTIDAQNRRIKNLAMAQDAADAVNKAYADALVLGGLPTPLAVANGGTGLTSLTGLLKGIGSTFVQAVGGTDYLRPVDVGTAATKDVGTAVGNVVQVQAGGKLPALDGSNLTGILTAPVVGAFSNLKASATGLSASVTVTADEISVEDGSNAYKTLRAVSRTIVATASGADGLDTGSLAASTWYAVFVIAKADGTQAGLLSLSATTPTMPTGYTFKARVGWVRTDGSGNKYPLGFKQAGRFVKYVVAAGSNVAALPIMASGTSGNPTTPTWTAVANGNFVPPTAVKIGIVLGANGSATVAAPNNAYGGVSSTTNPPPLGLGSLTSLVSGDLAVESGNTYYACTASGVMACSGWEDNL